MTDDQRDTITNRSSRTKVTLTCQVRQGTRPWKSAKLEDISAEGFRIAWLPNCRKQDVLRVRIPGMQILSAYIRWQDNNAVGCQFVTPLYPAVFEHIAKQAVFQE